MKAVSVVLLLALVAAGRAATIAELAASTPDLSILAQAAQAAGFIDELSDANIQLTVFAPSNAAFEKLLAALGLSAAQLLADQATLTSVLSYHVVPGAALSTDLTDGMVLQTLLPGGTLTVVKNDTGVFIQPTGGALATVVTPDIAADNGVVHIIDTVLLPGVAAAGAPVSEVAAVPSTE